MPTNLINKAVIKELAAKAAGLDNDLGDARLKEVFSRLLYDVMVAIDDLDVSGPQELHDILSSLPLFPFMGIQVTPLCRHPSSIREDDR